jgi:dipeptidyl aminopeptidase/acylaminoacyl peptidase
MIRNHMVFRVALVTAIIVAASVGLLALPSNRAGAAGRDTSAKAPVGRMDPDGIGKLARVGDPQIAPDGRSIVVVVSRPNMEKDRYESELVLVEIANGTQRVLTSEREDVSQPRWSPTGDRLAFLAKVGAGKDGKLQIFLMPMNGGDAKRLTDTPKGVQHYAWRPDGKEIAFAAADEAENKKAIEKNEDAFEIGDDSFLVTAAPTPTHIWLVPADGAKARRLTSGAWSLPVTQPPGSPSSPLSWSPDGKSIAFVRQASPHTGDSDERAIQIVDAAGGAIRPLTGLSHFEGYPSYSPDGGHIAYWFPRDGDPNNITEIYLAPATGGKGQSLTRALDRHLCRAIWMPDGKSLLVGGHDGTRVSMWLQPLDGPAHRLELGQAEPAWSFWIDANVSKDGAIAFAGSEPQHPPELYYMSSSNSVPRRLTDFNREVAGFELGNVETITWQGPDGFKEDGILVYPPGFSAGKKYPLVLLIHGGPRAASTEAFSALPQIFASHGYVVFMPNYRGSDNLGNAYEHAIARDSGAGPGRDVMAGLAAVKERGFVDPDRIAVSGWSYGGYMTTWLLGHYSGWKTAVAGAAVTDLLDQYSLSDTNVARRYALGGSPWVNGNLERYREQSPIAAAANIKTPTLILSDTGDARVPITNSYRLYHALKDNGARVKFFAYPVSGHSPSDPVRTRDVYRRWLAWLDENLR